MFIRIKVYILLDGFVYYDTFGLLAFVVKLKKVNLLVVPVYLHEVLVKLRILESLLDGCNSIVDHLGSKCLSTKINEKHNIILCCDTFIKSINIHGDKDTSATLMLDINSIFFRH